MSLKSTFRSVSLLLSVLSLALILSCGDDDEKNPDPDPDPDPDPEEVIADAGKDQVVESGELVTLDGSGSSGPDGFQYLWIYEGIIDESEIGFSGQTTVNPSFTPPVNGQYPFELKVYFESDTSVSNVLVTAEGVGELGGTIDEDLYLYNIESDPSKPDYLVIADLTIPNGLKMVVAENDVTIAFVEETGLIVESGGLLTNIVEGDTAGYLKDTRLISTLGWNGILVDGGTIELRGTTIERAGFGRHDGQMEKAALMFVDETSVLKTFEEIVFVQTDQYDIISTGDVVTETEYFADQIKFSAPYPYKAPLAFHTIFWENNIYPEDYEYIHIITDGLETLATNSRGSAYYFYDAKYHIDGGLWTDSFIFLYGDSHLLMSEGSGIIVQNTISASFLNPNTIEGIDGANWIGIGLKGPQAGYSLLESTTINNAGHGLFNTSHFESTVESVIYVHSRSYVGLKNCEINGSNGYGVYVENMNAILGYPISNTTFNDIPIAAIKTNSNLIPSVLQQEHGNIFNLDENVPAVLANEGTGVVDGTWPNIGANFYQIEVDLLTSGFNLTFDAGVTVRMGANNHIYFRPIDATTVLRANGTAENPVVFEGVEQRPGYWGGILIFGRAEMDHVRISDAGGTLLPEATARGNIVFRGDWAPTAPTLFTNAHISGSSTNGAVYEFGYDPGLSDPDNNITFSDNAGFDIWDAENGTGINQ